MTCFVPGNKFTSQKAVLKCVIKKKTIKKKKNDGKRRDELETNNAALWVIRPKKDK